MRALIALFAGLALQIAPLVSRSHAGEALKETAFNENFYSVHIIDDRAWIVGYYGAILHSPDRGLTWHIQQSPTASALFSVRFVNRDNGWIAGSYGTILHTTDSGKSWRPQPAGTTEHLFGLAMLDESHGWVVGSRGTTSRTENGGRSWTSSSIPGDFTFSAVAFVDRSRGWIVGEFGVIFQTLDGGKTWLKQKSPIEVAFSSGESRNLFALQLNGLNSGYAFGLDGLVVKIRAGNGWEVVRQRSAENKLAEANHLFAAAMSHDQIWAVGERGTLLRSEPDGKHWRQAHGEIPRTSLNGIAFGKDGFGLVVGNRGVVLRTEDGGASWQRLKINSRFSTKDLGRVP
jgi:photosystem II stability/assembly factor-like uncharacterized protein